MTQRWHSREEASHNRWRNKFLDDGGRFGCNNEVSPHTAYGQLERRFDGEIPHHLRRIALAGSATRLTAATARANSRCCDRLALAAGRNAAGRRGKVDPSAMIDPAAGDLAALRSAGLSWLALLD